MATSLSTIHTKVDANAAIFYTFVIRQQNRPEVVSMSKSLSRILPHLCIILSGVILVLVLIDKFNTQMNFIDNSITKNMLLVLSVLTVVCSIMLVSYQRHDN